MNMMMNYTYIVLHVLSIITSVMAGMLWMRSANVKVPAIIPHNRPQDDQRELLDHWVQELYTNLENHRLGLLKSTRYNKGAAMSAAVAAICQASVFVLNLVTDLLRL